MEGTAATKKGKEMACAACTARAASVRAPHASLGQICNAQHRKVCQACGQSGRGVEVATVDIPSSLQGGLQFGGRAVGARPGARVLPLLQAVRGQGACAGVRAPQAQAPREGHLPNVQRGDV